jgi:hypothetical protein
MLKKYNQSFRFLTPKSSNIGHKNLIQSKRLHIRNNQPIVESPPFSKSQVKKKVMIRIYNDLIKCLFVYISITTPSASVVNELQTGAWP